MYFGRGLDQKHLLLLTVIYCCLVPYSLRLTGFNGCDTLLEITVADVRYQVDVILSPDTLYLQ